MSQKYLCYILYLSGFLDLLGVSMIISLILPHARDLGASPTFAGILGSVYGGLQLFSSPLVGGWSDRIGRQMSMISCLLLSGFGYTILGIYSSLAIFFVGRFVLGCCKHSQTLSKAYLTEVVPKEERSAVLGNFNSFSSMGFILGPILGGHIAESSGGFSLVSMAVGAVFAVNAGIIWMYIPSSPEMKEDKKRDEMDLKREDTSTSLKSLNSDENTFSLTKFLDSFRHFDWADLWDLFLIKFFAGFSVILFRTNFTMVLKQKFVASPKTIGYMTSYTGVVATLSGFIIGKITKRYNNDAQLFLYVTIVQAVTLICLTLSPSLYFLVFFLAPLGFVTSVSRVSATTLTVSRSQSADLGSIMGLSQSVMAVARMMAPFIAGVAQEYSIDGASYISTLACGMSVLIMVLRPQDPSKRQKKFR